MLCTRNTTVIKAPMEVVFGLAAEIDRWPKILGHYRSVHFLDPEKLPRRRVFMAARRLGIPVSWTSLQSLEPLGHRILYRHVGGLTRGMEVEWRLEHSGEGILVTISHELSSPEGLLRIPPARLIAGRVFVHGIAARTLRGIKREAEKRVMVTA